MKKLLLLIALSIAATTAVIAQANRTLDRAGAVGAGKRTALVIGNGAYADSPLKNPPNDANDIGAALRTLGFEVLAYTDLDQVAMKRAIRDFGTKLKTKGGVGLFYYAGHGVQSKGVNYLIPVGAKVDSEEEVEYESIDAGFVLAQMDAAKNGMNIVILDACRNNPFARSFRSGEKGLASIDAPSGTLIAYATAPGSVASDGAGRNGLYTQELLKRLKSDGLSIEEVFKQVRISVRRETSDKQTPWEVSSLTGDFYFRSTTGAGSRPKTGKIDGNAGVASPAFELSYWDTIKDSTSADDYNAYLAKYPDGQFVELAQNRIKKINSEIEKASWETIRNSKSPDDFKVYLKTYPAGPYAALATERIRTLEEEAKASQVIENSRWELVASNIIGTIAPNKYEIQFLPNGVYKEYINWGVENGWFTGTWTQKGNTITTLVNRTKQQGCNSSSRVIVRDTKVEGHFEFIQCHTDVRWEFTGTRK